MFYFSLTYLTCIPTIFHFYYILIKIGEPLCPLVAENLYRSQCCCFSLIYFEGSYFKSVPL